jgi:hypothetical protein
VARASVGNDREQRAVLLGQLAARRNAASLAVIELPSPWAESAPDPAASALADQARDQMTRATAAVRSYPRLLFTDLPPVNASGRSPEQPPAKLGTAEAQAAIEAGWADGLTVRETARRATRAPSYVHSVFVRLDTERGPRPVNSTHPNTGA